MKSLTKEPPILRESAMQTIFTKFPEVSGHFNESYLDYWAYPQIFGSTAGPFNAPGRVSGQAMTTFTIEAWAYENYAVLFCQGAILKTTDEWKGPQTVRV